MDRQHCNRCDLPIERYRTWVESVGPWADGGSPHIVHFQTVNTRAHRLPPEFCLRCWVDLLRQYCEELMPPDLPGMTSLATAVGRVMVKQAKPAGKPSKKKARVR